MRLVLVADDGTVIERWNGIDVWLGQALTRKVLMDEIEDAVAKGERIHAAVYGKGKL